MTNHQSPAQTSSQQPGLAFFAIGMMGLGMVALIFGDFALVWQPVAAWIPGRTALAYGSGVLMMVCGAGDGGSLPGMRRAGDPAGRRMDAVCAARRAA